MGSKNSSNGCAEIVFVLLLVAMFLMWGFINDAYDTAHSHDSTPTPVATLAR
jgi:hypothetical protein